MCEMPSCYGHERRKARKAHLCCECHGTIQPGETYHYHHGVWDGEGSAYKVCMDCEALRADCDSDAEHDERTPFEGLSDSIGNMCPTVPEILVRFIKIKRRRGVVVPQWMSEREAITKLEREKKEEPKR